MPATLVLDHHASIVRSTFTGILSLSELRAARAALARTEGWSPEWRHLIDLSGVTAVAEPATEELQELAALEPLFAPNTLQVVVVRDRTQLVRVVRLFQGLASASQRNVQLVDGIDKACALLGS